jgi:hypothetical protein
MTNETYEKVMEVLDIIEEELDKLASVVDHESFEEFMKNKK